MKPIRAIGFDYFGVVGGVLGVDEKVLGLAEKLKAQGYKIGILSNIGGMGEELMRKKRLSMVDVVLTSGDIGVSKTDKRAFDMLAEKLGVELDEMVFMDDAHSYIEPMQSYGIRGILYTKYDRLIEELKEKKII